MFQMPQENSPNLGGYGHPMDMRFPNLALTSGDVRAHLYDLYPPDMKRLYYKTQYGRICIKHKKNYPYYTYAAISKFTKIRIKWNWKK